MTIPKTLIVEDAREVLRNMEMVFRLNILREKTPIRMSSDSVVKLRELGIDVAETYKDAEELINARDYRVILLDHNLPYSTTNVSCSDIGYSLIPRIRERNPNVVLIGTSSKSEVRNQPGLDFVLNKSFSDFGIRLQEIYSVMKGGLTWLKKY